MTTTLNRPQITGHGPPLRPRSRGEGPEPRGGLYWLKASSVVAITGTANEIVSLAGQTVMLDPQKFGLTSDEIMDWLLATGRTGDHSPAAEYQTLLDRKHDYDMSHVALLWKSSRVVFERMLRLGWAWVRYNPPTAIHFAMMPTVVQRQIASAAEHFALLQIASIRITLVTRFNGLSDKYPHISDNKTLTFSQDEFKSFAGSFSRVLDWASGKSEAPDSNYLYLPIDEMPKQLTATRASIRSQGRRVKCWTIRFYTKPIEGKPLVRVPISIVHKLPQRYHRGVTLASPNGMRALFSDRYFAIPASDLEWLDDGRWQSVKE